MSAARWSVMRPGPRVRCYRCPTIIGAGEQYRLVTSKDLPYCAACATAAFGEDPPPTMPTQPTPKPKPPEVWKPVSRSSGATQLTRQIRERLDARARQVGSE